MFASTTHLSIPGKNEKCSRSDSNRHPAHRRSDSLDNAIPLLVDPRLWLFEPGAAIGSASTSARDHRIHRFRRASSFSATRARFICFLNCCGRVAAFENRQVIYALHDATNNLIRRVAAVESIMTIVSTVAARRENHFPSHAGHK